MDLQLRKIHFVQEFLRLKNEQIIDKLEDILKSEKNKLYEKTPEPYTLDEFNGMIDRAEEDSKNSRMKSVHELKKDIKTWI
jgi:hypothetical protein